MRLLLACAVLLALTALAEGSYIYDHVAGGVPENADTFVNGAGVIYWHGDANRRAVALTFDDGPNEPYTSQLLAVLAEHDVKATFFMVGKRVAAQPAAARAIVDAGHAIGNHTYDHPHLPLEAGPEVSHQLISAEEAIERATGLRPRIYRPPFGAEDHFTREEGRRLGYVAVEWSDSSKDWLRPGVDAIVRNVLRHVENGSIILMHDGGGDRSQTVAAVRRIIPELQRRGFELVTVPDLLGLPQAEARPMHFVTSMRDWLVSHALLMLIFLWLLGGGLGLPLPEDLALLATGAMIFRHVTVAPIALAVAMVGVLAGDLLLFLVARRAGPSILERPRYRWLLSPAMETTYARHRGRLVFIARHLVGVRAATFTLAGARGMSLPRFLIWDTLAACVSVPGILCLGYALAGI